MNPKRSLYLKIAEAPISSDRSRFEFSSELLLFTPTTMKFVVRCFVLHIATVH